MTGDGETKIVLASESDRRRSLLEALGLDFVAITPEIEETTEGPGSARELTMKNAAAKAADVARKLKADGPRRLIIAADTIVVLDGMALGKPADREDAKRMLRGLSGRTHRVITGLAIRSTSGAVWVNADTSEVTFQSIGERRIADYVATGQADDKAGGYGIQGTGGRFVRSVGGDLTNVIGLPLGLLRKGILEMGGPFPVSKSLRQAATDAFPDLADLPGDLLAGIPD